MTTLRERLVFDTAPGVVRDGDRRYLLMRADVMMGALRALEPAARGAMLAALADAVERHGGRSLDAYAASGAGDGQGLIDATLTAAADLGWGRWSMQADDTGLELTVHNSPFAAGWAAAADGTGPIPPAVATCAPITGMLRALATRLPRAPAALRPAQLRVQELACSAQGAPCCRFSARWTAAA